MTESIKSEDDDKMQNKKLSMLELQLKEEEQKMTEKQFEACFSAVDDDNNGSISRDEMLQFILLVCDIEDLGDIDKWTKIFQSSLKNSKLSNFKINLLIAGMKISYVYL